MTQITLPYNIQPNTPEDITQVMSNLQAIVNVVNGTLDQSNFSAANIDGVAGTPSLRRLGVGSGMAAAGIHATQHKHGGSDEVAVATPAANAIPKAGAGGKLDTWISDAAAGTKGLSTLAGDFGGTAALPTVVGLKGDALPANLAHGFLKRTSGNAGWEEVPWLTANPQSPGTAAPGTANTVARGDHVHPQDALKANLAGPTFTGVPAAPTAAVGTNTTQIATTAYVQNEAYAKIAAPTFTGDAKAVTPAAADTDTSIATTAFVNDVSRDRVALQNSTVQALSNGVVASINFDTENFDSNGMHSGVSPERVICVVPGIYIITGYVKIAASAAGIRSAKLVLHSGANTYDLDEDRKSAASAGETACTTSAIVMMATNDYITLDVVQTSGGSLNTVVDVANGVFPRLMACRLAGVA